MPEFVTVERECSVLEERPLPGGRSKGYDRAGTISAMPAGASRTLGAVRHPVNGTEGDGRSVDAE
jgi:hypothetical protein